MSSVTLVQFFVSSIRCWSAAVIGLVSYYHHQNCAFLFLYCCDGDGQRPSGFLPPLTKKEKKNDCNNGKPFVNYLVGRDRDHRDFSFFTFLSASSRWKSKTRLPFFFFWHYWCGRLFFYFLSANISKTKPRNTHTHMATKAKKKSVPEHDELKKYLEERTSSVATI